MSDLKRTARITGLLYLGLAITGIIGFLVVRAQLHVPDAPADTLANLTDREWLARLGIALELGIVLTQALAALWFFRLFRAVSPVAAGAIAAFGLVNATMILVSAGALTTALTVALDPTAAPAGDAAGTVQLMYAVSDSMWAGGAVFFGLWLIPMGYAVLTSALMPRALGYILIVGGVGYVASAFAKALVPDLGWLDTVLTIPASVGEFWILGYLIIFGVRTPQLSEPSPQATATA